MRKLRTWREYLIKQLAANWAGDFVCELRSRWSSDIDFHLLHSGTDQCVYGYGN